MTPGPIIETDRLILRPIEAADFEPWAAFMADEEATRFLGGVQPRPAAWRGFLSMAGAWTIQGFSMFSVIEKVSGAWVGRLGPWFPESWPGTEVGWGIARAAWGKGYATEGARAAMDFAVETLGWSEVIHSINPGNIASQNVARRLGSKILRSANLPPPFEDEIVDIWGQSAAQWRASRS